MGEIANFIAGTCFIFVPSVIYRFKKGFPTVIVSLVIGIVLQVGASLFSNRFLTFPLYMGAGAESAFNSLFFVIVAFNLVKGVVNALIALLLYKRLKKLFFKNEIADKEKKTQTGEKDEDDEHVVCAYCGGEYKGENAPTAVPSRKNNHYLPLSERGGITWVGAFFRALTFFNCNIN